MAKQPKSRVLENLPVSPSVVQARVDQGRADYGTSWRLEQQFRLLVESVKEYAIFMLDAQGNIVSWNQGAERIKGYKAEEIVGRHFSCFYQAEDQKAGVPAKALDAAARHGRYEVEGWRVRKDGSRFWADVVMTALYGPDGRLLAYLKITRDLTERVQKERALQASEEALRQLSTQLLRIQDDERRRIGRDLHDGVSQYLAMLKMHLESLTSGPPLADAVQRKISDCIELATEAMKEIRTTSYELCPPMLEEGGLAPAIPWFLEGFMERSSIKTAHEVSDVGRLPDHVEIAVFRVLQECLANARRHSGTPSVYVRLHKNEGTLLLEVKDQGKGIPQDILDAFLHDCPGRLGVGLPSIKERIQELGGTLKVISNEGGTTITASVPVDQPRQKTDEPR